MKTNIESWGEHNDASKHAITIPIPKECEGNGEFTVSWNSHEGKEEMIHSFYWKNEMGELIATYTVGENELKQWGFVDEMIGAAGKMMKAANEMQMSYLKKL